MKISKSKIKKLLIKFSKEFDIGYCWEICDFKKHQGFNRLIDCYIEDLYNILGEKYYEAQNRIR